MIKNNSDTLFGVGKISKNQRYCILKEAGDQETKKYFPPSIEAFKVVDGKYFVAKQIQDDHDQSTWYFLEFLVDGEIDLYTIQKSDRFFLQKDGGDLIELKDDIKKIQKLDGEEYMVQNKKYLGYIRASMKDAPELYPKIDRLDRLNQRDLVNISVDYHNTVCDEYECINYTKQVPDVSFKLELSTGFMRHNNFYSPHVGLLLHTWLPMTNENLYIKAGIMYSDRPHWQKISPVHDSVKYNIKFPISLQYVFGKRNLKPTIALGFPTGTFLTSSFQAGFIYSFSKDIELNISASLDGLIRYGMNNHELFYNTPLAHSINIGFSYRLK